MIETFTLSLAILGTWEESGGLSLQKDELKRGVQPVMRRSWSRPVSFPEKACMRLQENHCLHEGHSTPIIHDRAIGVMLGITHLSARHSAIH